MIEMKVMGIALDTRTGSPIIVLNDLENRRALPIWIGSAEASSIIRKIEKIPSTRPLTHDLFLDFAKQTGHRVDRIEINDVDEQTYFASIFLANRNGEEVEIDSRPSDAIAIAIRAGVPIFVSPIVLADGGISTNSEQEQEETAEFKNFIKDIKPSDFAKLLDKNFESDQ